MASDSIFEFGVLKEENGILTVDGSVIEENSANSELYIGFDPISSGKAEISFNAAFERHNKNANPSQFGSIERRNENLMSGYLKLGFGSVTEVINQS